MREMLLNTSRREGAAGDKGEGNRLPAAGWFRLDAFGFISRNCITVISGPRPLSPLWCLRHHLFFPPAKAGALWILSNVPHSSVGKHKANFPLRGKSRAAGIGVHFHAPQARLYGLRCLRQRCRRRRLSPPERSERNPFTQPAAQPRPFPPSEPRAAEGPLHFHFKKNKMVGMKILQ